MMERGDGRRFTTWPVLALLLLMTFFFQACVSRQPTGKGAEISILYHGKICRSDVSTPLVIWLGRAADLRELDDKFVQGLDGAVVAELMAFDFSENGILLLGPGNRGPASYNIRLGCSILDIVDHTALLQLKFLQKSLAAEKQQDESCTPAVLVKIPKGDYHHIQAWDEKGLFMVKIRIPEI